MRAVDIEWDGTHLPAEFAMLPAGRYVVAAFMEVLLALPDDESWPYPAINELEVGNGVAPEAVLDELRRLPPGRYSVESLDEPEELTPEEEAGIEEALNSLDAGEGIPLEEVMRELRSRYS